MVNGQSKNAELIVPPTVTPGGDLWCHRFYVGLALPQADKLDPRRATVTPQVANFNCVKEKCMLWNDADKECWEKTAFKAQALQGEWAHAQRNDVLINSREQ